MCEILAVLNFVFTLLILAFELHVVQYLFLNGAELFEINELLGPTFPVAFEVAWNELLWVDAPLANHDLAISALDWLPHDSETNGASVVLNYLGV